MKVQANKLEITRTWKEPVYESKRLGSIPDDHYESAWLPGPYYGTDFSTSNDTYLSGETPEAGNQEVWRDVPVYNVDGSVKMNEVTRTLSEAAYDPKKSTMISGGVGGALGIAAGAGLSAILGGGGAAIATSGLLGGAAGAGAGYLIGKKSTEGDEVVEKTATAEIVHPRLTGYEHTIDPDVYYSYETHGNNEYGHQGHAGSSEPNGSHTDSVKYLRGYQHTYSPILDRRVVGTYTYPTLEHTAKLGPGWGGFLAGAAGLGAGAGIAALVCAVL